MDVVVPESVRIAVEMEAKEVYVLSSIRNNSPLSEAGSVVLKNNRPSGGVSVVRSEGSAFSPVE